LIIRDYTEGDYRIKEYSSGAIVKQLISQSTVVLAETQATIGEQILAENLYQTALLEMQMLGGV
jgi:hypothetical protein